MLKIAVFALFVAIAHAGIIAGPVSHGATSHSSIVSHASPVGYGAPQLSASLAYASPVSHYAAPVSHGATSHSSIVSHASPVGYAAPQLSYGQSALSYGAPRLSSPLAYSSPVAHYAAPIAKAIIAEPSAPAHYDFEYSVHDPHTGDVKSQKESRKGDVVHGSYSLVEADGSRRVVEYTADAHNGFNAVVHREPGQHPVAVKAVAPVIQKAIVAAPVAHYGAPALSYGSPIGHQISHY